MELNDGIETVQASVAAANDRAASLIDWRMFSHLKAHMILHPQRPPADRLQTRADLCQHDRQTKKPAKLLSRRGNRLLVGLG